MASNEQRVVMLTLHRRILTEIFTNAIEKRPRMAAIIEHEYIKLETAVKERKPDVALLEVPERSGTPAQDTLTASDQIKTAHPSCKVMLMCPAADKKSVNECIRAKREKRIDDFLFYDASPDYLATVLESMLSIECRPSPEE